MLRSLPILSFFALVIAGCDGLVSTQHPINNEWTFVHYRLSDGTLDSLNGFSKPRIIFKKSSSARGNGPARNFESECLIYVDGEIEFQNLNLIGEVEDSLFHLVDSVYFERLLGASRYTLDGDRLVLTSETDGVDIVLKK